MKQRLSDKEFTSIYGRVPRFCVESLVQTKDGILITKRNIYPHKGYWHFSGGTVYLGESIKKAVKRIAKEELNLDVEIIKPIGEMEFLHNYKKKGQQHSVSIAFLVKTKDIRNLKLNEQGNDVMFCKFKEDVPKYMVKEHSVLLTNFLESKNE